VRAGSVFRKWWPVPAAAIAAGALVTGLGGHGGYGLFSSAQTVSDTLGAGQVTLDLNGSSSSSTSWNISDVAPGDYYEAPVTLSDTGSIGISTVSLSATTGTTGTSTSLYSATTSPSGEDPVYVYALDCQGGTWIQAASGDPYSCTPPSGSSTTPTVTTVLGAVPACASSSNPADLSTCETSSYWMNPSGAVDAVPSGAVGVTSTGITSTPLSLPTTKGASGESDALPAPSGSQSNSTTSPLSANVLLVEYVNPNVTSSAEGASGSLSITFTGTQRAGTLRSSQS
jgi:hypothetical protein